MTYSCNRDDGSIVKMSIIDNNTTIEAEIEKYNSFMKEKIISYILNNS